MPKFEKIDKQSSQPTPGVVFYSVSGKPFYVDVLHALNLQTKQELERILSIESEVDFEYEINKLCFTPLMKKAYTTYNILLNQSKYNYTRAGIRNYTKNKLLFLYYYVISPKLVPIQFKYPVLNRLLYKIVDKSSDGLLYILNQDVLTEEKIFEAKIKGAKRKMIYASQDTRINYANYGADLEKKIRFFEKYNAEKQDRSR